VAALPALEVLSGMHVRGPISLSAWAALGHDYHSK
jgi:hypothetical protein